MSEVLNSNYKIHTFIVSSLNGQSPYFVIYFGKIRNELERAVSKLLEFIYEGNFLSIKKYIFVFFF